MEAGSPGRGSWDLLGYCRGPGIGEEMTGRFYRLSGLLEGLQRAEGDIENAAKHDSKVPNFGN